MKKLGLIILVLILGIVLGGIIQEQTCKVAEQDLGTGTTIMKTACLILSIPLDLIVLFLFLIGIIIYLIYKNFN